MDTPGKEETDTSEVAGEEEDSGPPLPPRTPAPQVIIWSTFRVIDNSIQVMLATATPTSLSPGVRRAMATPRSRGGLMVGPKNLSDPSPPPEKPHFLELSLRKCFVQMCLTLSSSDNQSVLELVEYICVPWLRWTRFFHSTCIQRRKKVFCLNGLKKIFPIFGCFDCGSMVTIMPAI